MSECSISSAMLVTFTDPPYWTRSPLAGPSPATRAATERTAAHMAWASSAVALRPVPMAQMGS